MPVFEAAACPGQNFSGPFRILKIPNGPLPAWQMKIFKRRMPTAKSSPANMALVHCLPRPNSGRTVTPAARIPS
eukprot:6164945-Heterocapsa_arctica.AAC.1